MGYSQRYLERDFNIPPIKELLSETDKIRQIQQQQKYEQGCLMSDLPSFQQAQFKLANIIRTGEGRISMGWNNVRLKIYQELFFNNVEGFCSTAFPVFKSLLR